MLSSRGTDPLFTFIISSFPRLVPANPNPWKKQTEHMNNGLQEVLQYLIGRENKVKLRLVHACGIWTLSDNS